MPSASPARSTAPSTVDGSARKVRKLDKELAKYQIEAIKNDRDKKLEAIYDRFKNDPDAIESTYTMLFVERKERGAIVDDDTPFSSKCVVMWKVPKTFLAHWIPSISRMKDATLAEVCKKNPAALQEAMCRALVVDPADFFGPTAKADWKAAMEDRHASRGCKFDALIVSDGYFDWDRCGLYMLHPPLVADADPKAHIYKSMKFEGIEVEFDTGFVVSGTAKVMFNWSHTKATLIRPGYKPEKLPCSDFFAEDEKYIEITEPVWPHAEKKRAGKSTGLRELARVRRMTAAKTGNARDTAATPPSKTSSQRSPQRTNSTPNAVAKAPAPAPPQARSSRATEADNAFQRVGRK